MTWTYKTGEFHPESLLLQESLFALANGYIGVRGNLEEGLAGGELSIRGSYINAFYDETQIHYGEKLFAFPETQEKLVNIIDTQTIELFFGVEEERFSLFAGEVMHFERKLYLDKGFSERIVHWRSPLGKEVVISFKRLVSIAYRELFVQQITIKGINFDGPVKIVSLLNGDVANYTNANDPRVASGHAKLLKVIDVKTKKELQTILCETSASKLQVACNTRNWISKHATVLTKVHQDKTVATYETDLDQPVVFEKQSVYTDTRRHGIDLAEKGEKLLQDVCSIRFEAIAEKQEAILQSFWKVSDIEIEGDHRLQEGIRFNMFHLFQSAGRDDFSNIAAKGLSGEGYEGHYFWDTEIYMLPFFTLTEPSLAKSLLRYRYSILEGARERAKEMGHQKGALFPWRTIAGRECSGYFPAGTAQYHISADVAYSYIQYYLATKDSGIWSEFGAEVLFETARLWIEVGHFADGTFRIDAVTGPDEYTCIVNNNYYTNVLAKYNLQWAAKVYQLLKDTDPVAFDEIKQKIQFEEAEADDWMWAAQHMYLPYDPERKINPQDDSFLQKAVWNLADTPKEHYPLLLHYHPLTLYRYQVCKQADTVLAHFLLEDEQDLETMQASYEYYEKVTTHDSSLSSCIFSIMAVKLGNMEKAYNYFMETARLDLDNTHGNTKDGLHMANMGGTWMAIVYGFGGLRIKENGISLTPRLPKQWTGYKFRFRTEGTTLEVKVEQSGVSIKKLTGKGLSIKVYGEDYYISNPIFVGLQ
ncbi:alpha,alpha-trehalose phosphorylase [Bacillus oleivorans]|uniref:Alpha,alpha-trehalose phosphorylase n=1 Tax=Bacillus oleivorans TaxID=1448271 RepID=A0A285CH13_9BACI|nr:glycosyl hydrolase family 65 protein [Bacillus oleivorans]SNX66887.1 alpha,alpha-trehalose phosphorylase [Bacillus oleivorans]